jgi:transcription initiation factor TFIID subunit 5
MEDLGYSMLAHYIHNTLEVYRPQLNPLLFPVFAHVFMKLIATNQLAAAQKLLKDHGEEHEQVYGTEMSQLRLIVDLEHMRKNSWARRVLRSTDSFIITVGKTAQILLATFLEEHRLKQINHILNSKVKLSATYVHPVASAQNSSNSTKNTNDVAITSASSSSSSSSTFTTTTLPSVGGISGSGITGVTQDMLQHTNQTLINWGVVCKRPRTDVMDRAKDLKNELKEFISSEEKIKPAEKKRRIRRLESNIRDTEEEARTPLWIGSAGTPPSLNGEFYRDMVEKLRLRVKPIQKRQEEQDDIECVKLGYLQDHKTTRNTSSTGINVTTSTMIPALPSIACLSLKNNYDSLSCTAVSRDAVQIAGGYSDGIVRVWRLDGNTHLGETYGYIPSKEDSPLANHNGLVESAAHLVGHTMGVTGCAFMPDNEWLLSCSEDSSVRLWHLKSKSMVSAYKSSADSLHPVWDVACSPMGYYFASASHDRTASLWSPERSSPVRRFVGHLSDVETVVFHPNATIVATGSMDRTVRLWDVRSGGCVRLFSSSGSGGGGGSGAVNSLAFSPNGEHVVSGGDGEHLTVWSVAEGKMLHKLGWKSAASKSTVRSLEYSKDGTVLASSTTDRCVRCWDASIFHQNKDREELMCAIDTKATDVYDLTFTERNLLVASGCTREKRVVM